jgi:folate-binding protein YgfZ
MSGGNTLPVMEAARWRIIEERGGVLDLSARAKWLLTGSDRVRYLNGQCTNDIRRAGPRQTVYACVTDVKGRVCADIVARATEDGDGLLVDAPAAAADTLGPRLEHYIVADDVEMEEVTGQWRLLHFFGPAAQFAPEDAASGDRLGCEGRDVWLPANADAPSIPDAELWVSDSEAEVLRVLRGVPAYPAELNDGVFPPEAGLEERAMDFAKGCYIGQEILSRIRTTRKMPRVLVRWQAEGAGGGEPPRPGAELAPEASGGAAVGAVTSAVIHPVSGLPCGLAFLKQGAAAQHSRLLVGGEVVTIQTQWPAPPHPVS